MAGTRELPDLASSFVVPAGACQQFSEHGHTVVHGLATPAEVEAYRSVIHEATLRHAWDRRPLDARDTYGKAFLQAANLWRRDQRIRRFTFSRRFAGVAAQLLGVERLRLYHDQALFKEGGGGPTPWHQDQCHWPLDSDRTITMWMPLVDVPAEVGSMRFVSGSHRRGYLGDFGISDESEARFAEMIEREDLAIETHGPLRAGSATFHAGWTVHAAPANPTGTMRAVMTVIYVADGVRVAEPANDAQRVDAELWLAGLEPGDLVAGDTHPVLFEAADGAAPVLP